MVSLLSIKIFLNKKRERKSNIGLDKWLFGAYWIFISYSKKSNESFKLHKEICRNDFLKVQQNYIRIAYLRMNVYLKNCKCLLLRGMILYFESYIEKKK